MSANIGIGNSWDDPTLFKDGISLTFESDGYYWFLYRYFESANLDTTHELIDLYGGAEIDGYELDRLEEELITALNDIQWREENWEVLTGWNGEEKNKKAEIRRVVSKVEMKSLINKLLSLVSNAKSSNQKLICLGD